MTAIAELVDDVRKKKNAILPLNDVTALSASADEAADESITNGSFLEKEDAFMLPEKPSIREPTTKVMLKTKLKKVTAHKAKLTRADDDDRHNMDESFSSTSRGVEKVVPRTSNQSFSSSYHATGVGTKVDQKKSCTNPLLLPNAVATRKQRVNDDFKAVNIISSKVTLVKSASEVEVTPKLTAVQQKSLVNADNDGTDSRKSVVPQNAKKSEKVATHTGTKENKSHGIINDHVLQGKSELSSSSYKKKSRNVEPKLKREIRAIDPFNATPKNELHTPDCSGSRNNNESGVAVVSRQKIATAWPTVTVGNDDTGKVSAIKEAQIENSIHSADGNNSKPKARTSKTYHYQDTSRGLSLVSESNAGKSTMATIVCRVTIKDDKKEVSSTSESSKHEQSAELSTAVENVNRKEAYRSPKNDDDDDRRETRTSTSNIQDNRRTQGVAGKYIRKSTKATVDLVKDNDGNSMTRSTTPRNNQDNAYDMTSEAIKEQRESGSSLINDEVKFETARKEGNANDKLVARSHEEGKESKKTIEAPLILTNNTDNDKPMSGTNAQTNQVDAVGLSMLDLDALDEGLAKVWAKFDDKASNEKALLDAAEAKAASTVTPDDNKAKKEAGTFDEMFAPEVGSGKRDGVLLQPGCTKEKTKSVTEAEPIVKVKTDAARPHVESSQDYNHIPAKQPHKMLHEASDEESTLASTVTGFYGSPVSYVEFSKLQDGLSHDDNMTTTTMKVQEVAPFSKEDGSLAVDAKGRANVISAPNDSRLSFLPKLLAIDLWSESSSDVQAALQQFAGLCAREQNIADILKHGGHLSLTVILRKWPASSIIQNAGLAALYKAAESLEFSTAVVQLGALDLVIVAMKNHAANAEVLVAGCGALLNLTVSAAHAKILVFELQGIQTICEACAAYPANTTLQKYALWIVQYFSYWEDFKAPIVAAGGLEILSEMVENFSASSRCDGSQSVEAIRKSALATMKRLL